MRRGCERSDRHGLVPPPSPGRCPAFTLVSDNITMRRTFDMTLLLAGATLATAGVTVLLRTLDLVLRG